MDDELALRLRDGLANRGIDLDEVIGRTQFVRSDPFVVRAGLSGGPDSTALALLARACGARVIGVHVDHGLRPDSGREGAVIAERLWPFGVTVVERRVRVALGPNLEARAREARLRVLGEAATGHTLDDQAETLLLNLLRGAGPRGLGAMEPGPRHPLLGVRRSETRAVCEAAGVAWLEDPMNSDDRYARVRVRDELLPLASEIARRDVAPLLARSAELARALEASLDLVLARGTLPWEELTPPLQRRAIAAWVRGVTGQRTSSAHLEAVRQVAVGARPAHILPDGVRVERDYSGLRLVAVDGSELGRWPDHPRDGRLESVTKRGEHGVAGG